MYFLFAEVSAKVIKAKGSPARSGATSPAPNQGEDRSGGEQPEVVKDGLSTGTEDEVLKENEEKMSSVQPTMWMGTQSGRYPRPKKLIICFSSTARVTFNPALRIFTVFLVFTLKNRLDIMNCQFKLAIICHYFVFFCWLFDNQLVGYWFLVGRLMTNWLVIGWLFVNQLVAAHTKS